MLVWLPSKSNIILSFYYFWLHYRYIWLALLLPQKINDTYFIYLFFILAFLTSFGHCYPMHTPKKIWSVLQFDVVHLWTAQRSWQGRGVWVCCQISEFDSLLCPSLVTTSQVLDLWHAYYHTFDVHIFYQA